MTIEMPAAMPFATAASSQVAVGDRLIQAGFIPVSDGRWRSFLDRVTHDFYHRPEYIRFCGEEEGGEPLAFLAEDGDTAFLLPLLKRPLPAALAAPAEWHDVLTPYGYPSPLLCGDANRLPEFFAAFRQHSVDAGIVSAFFRLHPLLPLPLEPLREFGRLLQHGQTVAIDLGQDEQEIWRAVRENHRRDIKRLQKLGYTVRLDAWEHYDDFIAIYLETMERLQAGSFYFFLTDYFNRLRTAIGDLHLCTVLAPDGRVAAGGLFACQSGILEYHLGGTSGDFLAAAPSKLMFDFIWRWGKATGQKIFHLGGGLGGREDSLFRFKEGFSPRRADFFTCRAILDEAKYSFLAQRWQRLATSETAVETDFFPVYRCPLREEKRISLS